jgi:hypothetical protein
MLAIMTWLWGDAYGPEDVRKLARGLARNLQQTHRLIVLTDRIERFDTVDDFILGQIPPADLHLTTIKGCFVRLRLFDPGFQRELMRAAGHFDRIVNMDLDCIPVGPLDPLFNRPDPFCILLGANAANPCPYNGSVFMLRPGTNARVWTEFNLDSELAWRKGDEASRIARPNYYEFPDDQGWLATCLPNASAWQVGARSGIYAFMKPGWPMKYENDRRTIVDAGLPPDARLVCFFGSRKPSQFTHLPWVQEHWR